MSEKKWFENQEFWETFRDHMFPSSSIKKAKAEVSQIVKLADIGKEERILDIPCGVGRHSVPLAEAGYSVRAVDLTEPYIEEARDKAANSNLEIEFSVMDMREFSEGSYDVVLHLWNSLGYFEDRKDDRRMLENFYEILNSGGRLVMDVKSKEIIARDFQEKIWHEENGMYFLQKRKIKGDWEWMEYKVIAVNGEERKVHDMSHRLYSARELKQMLRMVGFSSIDVYGNFKGEKYGQDADKLVLIAEK